MAVCPSDGDIYAGWKSTGRTCALFGAIALAVAVLGFSLTHGHSANTLALSDQMLAYATLWVGGSVFFIMAAAACGSILVSVSERGGVEVTSDGVRRIFKPGREEFFPRQEIAGFVPRSAGGVILIGNTNQREMVIPRSIEGYRDCIAELKAMGIGSLPACRLKQGWASRKLTLAEWVSIVFSSSVWSFFFRNEGTRLEHHIAGSALVTLLMLGILREDRKTGKRHWAAWSIAAAVAIAVAWCW